MLDQRVQHRRVAALRSQMSQIRVAFRAVSPAQSFWSCLEHRVNTFDGSEGFKPRASK